MALMKPNRGVPICMLLQPQMIQLVFFDRNLTSGNIAFSGVLKNAQIGGIGLNGAMIGAISLDDKHIYTTAKDDHALSWFDRNTSTCHLSFKSF